MGLAFAPFATNEEFWHTVVESLLDNWNLAQTRFQLGDIFSIKKVKH